MIRKALVINDDYTSSLIATKFIDRAGFASETVTAGDGQLGLAFFEHGEEGAPDFIFLDLFMPIMNGWEFLEKFSSQYAAQFPNVRIAIISSYVHPDDEAKLQQYDVVLDCLTTPMNLEKLAELKQKYDRSESIRLQTAQYTC